MWGQEHAFLVVLIMALSLLISPVNGSALGLSPSSFVLDFEPNLNKTFFISVRSTKDLDIYVKGDLQEYFKVEKTFLDCPCNLEPFRVDINLPEKLDRPGIHETRVGVIETIPSEGGTIGARAAFEGVYIFKVPYPGRYVKIDLKADSVKVGDTVSFLVTANSAGTENVTGTLKLEIFDSNGVKKATLYSDNNFVESKKSIEIRLSWDTEGMVEGIYTAKATFEYGGDEPAVMEKGFRVGDILIRIIDVLNNETVEDEIAKFVVKVESFWNSRINDVYAALDVRKDGRNVGESKSSNVNVEPWSVEDMNIYWDTSGIEPGTYDAIITVYYQNKTAEKTIETKIVQKPQFDIVSILLVIMALSVAIAAFLAYRFRRKKKGRAP
ncbi:MAG: hypothetical protein JXC85_02650 [Candidatus Aenigmarchaeota archaeon]|nr:hypothetical protein [Candidatus Aenigmarchaeota archaeon]